MTSVQHHNIALKSSLHLSFFVMDNFFVALVQCALVCTAKSIAEKSADEKKLSPMECDATTIRAQGLRQCMSMFALGLRFPTRHIEFQEPPTAWDAPGPRHGSTHWFWGVQVSDRVRVRAGASTGCRARARAREMQARCARRRKIASGVFGQWH